MQRPKDAFGVEYDPCSGPCCQAPVSAKALKEAEAQEACEREARLCADAEEAAAQHHWSRWWER